MGNTNTKKRKLSSNSQSQEREQKKSSLEPTVSKEKALFDKIHVATFANDKFFRWYDCAEVRDPIELTLESPMIAAIVDPHCTQVALHRRLGVAAKSVIDLWSIAENKLLDTVREVSPDASFAFSNDSSKICLCSDINKSAHVRIWHVLEKKFLLDFIREQSLIAKCHPCFAANDTRLIISSSGGLRVYDIITGRRLMFSLDCDSSFKFHISLIIVSSTGTLCAAFAEVGFTVWNYETGAQQFVVHHPDISGMITAGAMFAGDKLLLHAYCLRSGCVAIWDTGTGEQLRAICSTENIRAIAYNAENNTVALALKSNVVTLYDGNTSEKLAESRAFQANIFGVYCSTLLTMLM
jgi:WD40 repeat protein